MNGGTRRRRDGRSAPMLTVEAAGEPKEGPSRKRVDGSLSGETPGKFQRDEPPPGAFPCTPAREKATFGSVISAAERAVLPLWQAVNGLASPNIINPAASTDFVICFRMGNDS